MLYASAGARDTAELGIYQGFQLLDTTTGDAFVTGSNIPRNDNNEAAQAGLRFSGESLGITHQLNLGYSHSRYVNRNAFEFGRFDDDALGGTNLTQLYAPRTAEIGSATYRDRVGQDSEISVVSVLLKKKSKKPKEKKS